MQRSHSALQGRASPSQSTATATRTPKQQLGSLAPRQGRPRAATRTRRSGSIICQTDRRAAMVQTQQAPCWVAISATRSGGGVARRQSRTSKGRCGGCSMAVEQVLRFA